MQFDFDPALPIYQQIIDAFRRAIARGQLAPGDRIMSQRELAQIARVSPNTAKRAYREMEQMGLTETIRGQGSSFAGIQRLFSRSERKWLRGQSGNLSVKCDLWDLVAKKLSKWRGKVWKKNERETPE